MARLGFLCFPGTGHLNPVLALGRQLQARGHDVTVFHGAVAKPAVVRAGLRWSRHDGPDAAPASTGAATSAWTSKVSKLPGWADTFSSLDVYEATARRALAWAPEAVRAARLDGLIVDQANLAGGTIADALRLPFVTLSTSPVFESDARVPPAFFGWRYRTGVAARARNLAGYALVGRLIAPVLELVNDRRRAWGLPPLRGIDGVFSTRAVIANLPEAFDFPRGPSSLAIVYAGPLCDRTAARRVPFTWERLDGRPLIYASMGTIRNGMRPVFRTIAEACAALNVQLVLSLGGGTMMPGDLGPLPGDPIVTHYAPQLDLLERASLTISHAGLNTALESLASGVPLVAIPIADDQPGVAARLRWTGTGIVMPLGTLSAAGLRGAIARVLANPGYRAAARHIAAAIQGSGGPRHAACVVEDALLGSRTRVRIHKGAT